MEARDKFSTKENFATLIRLHGYILMVNMLSIGILLGVEDTIFCQLAMVSQKEKLNDFLINYFLHYTCKIDVSVNSVNFLFSRPYAATKEVISFADKDKTLSVDRLKKYLSQEWYRGHSGCGWHNMHKINISVHSGYWSFESGALVKVLKLDDSSLKGLLLHKAIRKLFEQRLMQ